MNTDLDLQKQARHRFLMDIIQQINAKYNGTGTILILDEITASIINHFLTLAELTENGVVVIENIVKQRKDFPTFRAVYFIIPDKANFDIIEDDFGKAEPKYANLHIFFTKRIPDEEFLYMKAKKFIKKTKTMKEVNMHVKLYNDYLFVPYEMTNKPEVHIDTLISTVSHIPNIESIEVFKLINPLYKESATVYKSLELRIKELLPYVSQEATNSVKLFIFDRTLDLVTPLIHDFHYENLLTDLLQEHKLSRSSPDFVFKKFRNKFIKDCILGIGADFEKFLNENPIAKLQRTKDNEDVDIDQLGVAVRGITEFNEIIKAYDTHLDFVKKINVEVEKHEIKELAELEYNIITGVDDYGEAVDTATRFASGQKYLDTLYTRKLDQIRLLMIMHGALYKDLSIKANLIDEPQYREAFNKYIQLVAKYGKYWPEKDKENLKKMTKVKYKTADSSLQRYICKSEFLVSSLFKSGKADQFDTFKYGETKGGFTSANKTLFKGKLNLGISKTGSHTYIVIYFIGGISFAEIQAFKSLETQLGDGYSFIMGGSDILSAKDFINKLSDINI